ncbi:MAG: NAD-dependent epimerase/dehydratase family protein [Actinomycetota bacterium]
MIALVTGAAGFVGSHLSRLLLEQGHRVRGVDCFTPYYAREDKERHVADLVGDVGFDLLEADLGTAALDSLLGGVQVVFHLAGQPGVRPSWGSEFGSYVRHNIEVTQRLLEATRGHRLTKFVYASSSSVYGDAEAYPTTEDLRPRPVSPYGVTKLAAEHLCEVYRTSFGVPTVSLRLFTVYGPGQRPDMAFSKLVGVALGGGEFELFGDGEQTRDFTFVGDVVRAMRDAARSPWCGVANVGGGSRTSMNRVIQIVRGLYGPVRVVRRPVQRGDVRHTAADISVAAEAFGYRPRTSIEEGLALMVARHRQEMLVP